MVKKLDFSKAMAQAAAVNKNVTIAAASVGGYSFGVVNSKNNGKRLSFSKALVAALDLEDTVELLPAAADGVLFAAKELPADVSFKGKLSGEGKKICYSGSLVGLITSSFNLDYSGGKTSKSFSNIEIQDVDGIKVAAIYIPMGECADTAEGEA